MTKLQAIFEQLPPGAPHHVSEDLAEYFGISLVTLTLIFNRLVEMQLLTIVMDAFGDYAFVRPWGKQWSDRKI